ncbi:MAG: methyl-accepting chemotaxis protein [bacterium]
MMKNWSIRKRLQIGITGIILICVVMIAYVIINLIYIRSAVEIVGTNSIPSIDLIVSIESHMQTNYALVHKHLLAMDTEHATTATESGSSAHETSTPQQIEAEIAANAEENLRMAMNYEKMLLDEADRKGYDNFLKTREKYVAARKNVIALSNQHKIDEARNVLTAQLDPAYSDYLTRTHDIAGYNEKVAVMECNDIIQRMFTLVAVSTVGLLIVVVLSITIGIAVVRSISVPMNNLAGLMSKLKVGDFTMKAAVLRRDELGAMAESINQTIDDLRALVEQVQRSGIQVNTSSTEIAVTSREQQSTANEVAASTAEIGATAKEIYATSKELLNTSEEVSSVAEQTSELASNSKDMLSRMETNMRAIMDASASITAKLTDINEKAGNISSVVTTITKVADQTNLLSLNAAIEAEKAGEYGRGFSVVATEIRRLADQTAEATLDIEQMVKGMTSAVSAGVMGMDKFSGEVRHGVDEVRKAGQQIDKVVGQVQSLAPNFEAVNEGLRSQTIASQQISDALVQLSEAMQQTVESLRQSSIAIEQLDEASSGLQNGISHFKLA